MAREFARAFYDSPAWRKCRAAFIAERRSIDGGMCQACGVALGYIVHHTIPLSPENIDDPDISLNHDRLAYVCQACHNRIDMEKDDRYTFDADGQPVPLPPIRENQEREK